MKLCKILLPLLLLAGCHGQSKKATGAWLNENNVRVAIDASFQSVMDGIVSAYGYKNVEASVSSIYTSEDSVLWLLKKDSVRCAIATRPLTQDEKDFIKATYKLTARQQIIAYDAFALIVNKACSDTVITTAEIRDIVSGKITRWEQLSHSKRKGELHLLFDQSGSSTVRFMRDSLCHGQELKGNIYAQGSHLSVIEAVRQRTDIIGVVSTDWLRSSGTSAMTNFRDLDVRVMLVSRGNSPEQLSHICRPYQYYIATGEYPLIRAVYAINTDPRPQSKQSLFYYFVKGDKGQRIICNDSQLLPYLSVQIRDVYVHD